MSEQDDYEEVKRQRKRFIMIVGIIGAMLLGLCFGIGVVSHGRYSPSNLLTKQGDKTANTYMEDETNSEDKITIEEKEKASEGMDELNKNVDKPKLNSHPDTLAVAGGNYFLFSGDILLPISSSEWREYVIPASNAGAYSQISEYYLSDESPSRWSQKFTIHKLKKTDTDSYAFMEKLINGVIVNVSDKMTLMNEQLSKDDIEFNYVKKSADDSLMYWGLKNNQEDPETQFVRVFRSEYSGELIVSTFTCKIAISSVSDNFVADKMKALESIQQLKKKG